jgi:DegV family protein with EDD domain
MLAIITDSTCDIPDALIEQYGIIVVSHYIIWGEEQFKDRVTLQPKEFYRRYQKDTVRPTSAQASVQDFLDAIQTAITRGATEAIVLTVSSAMSGAFQMANQAAERADIPVSVIDSKGPTMSLGWQVLAAARAREGGKTTAEIIEQVKKVRQNLVQIVAMESLEYLQTGGRIGEAAKWVGTVLKVRPVVAINHEKGVVTPIGLARTHKAMVDMLYRKFFNGLTSTNHLRIAVLHGDALEEAQALAERIRTEYHPEEILINITGPVLGINTGPKALALCGYDAPGGSF